MTRWIETFRHHAAGVWFRATIYAVAAVLIAVAAWAVSALLPSSVTIELGQDAVGTLLQILASSMLAVATFSLTTMVSAYSAPPRWARRDPRSC